jgi:hypothetical protein
LASSSRCRNVQERNVGYENQPFFRGHLITGTALLNNRQ